MNSSYSGMTAAHAGPDALAALDLNLLTALRALIEERSVTRAALRLGLTQPGTSAVLRRLRAHFDDPLLVRTGPAYDLSPLAAALLIPVATALTAVESVLLGPGDFRPETSSRTFSLMAADSSMALLGEHLLPHLIQAPGIKLDFVPVNDEAMDDLDQTLQSVDALFMPHGPVTGYPSTDLWTDEWALLTGTTPDGNSVPGRSTPEKNPGPSRSAQGNNPRPTGTASDNDRSPNGSAPAGNGSPSESAPGLGSDSDPLNLSDLIWISSFHGGPSPVTAALESWGIKPLVRAVVPSYLALPLLLANNPNHVAILQRRLAERLQPLGGTRILPGPPEAPLIRLALWWHPSRTQDPAHTWLRKTITAATAALSAI